MKSTFLWVFFWFFWIGTCSYVGWKNLDPDYGWHIRVGQYITDSGIPKTDPFSYTMPSYPFIDHEWLTNIVMYRLLAGSSYETTAVFFGFLSGILIAVMVDRRKIEYAIVPLLMAAGVWISRGGVRPQVLDWIFLAVMLKLAWRDEVWRKWRWLTVIIFALWANLHGGFAIGPVVLGVIIAVKSWERRELDWIDVGVWLGGVSATFVNPYGPRLWHEVYMQITDHNLRWSVAEWQPFWVRIELGIWMLFTLTAALLKITEMKIEKWKLAVTVGLLIAGLSSLRHISLLGVMLVLLSSQLIEEVANKLRSDKITWGRAKKFFLLIVGIAGTIFLEEVFVFTWQTQRNKTGLVYPEKAIGFLRGREYQGKVFSEYAWGGYLLWKYPEEKVFIDGRMPSWRWKAPEGESDWVFKDYTKIKEGGEFLTEFEKYDIRVVLWPRYNLSGEIPSENLGWWAKLMRLGLVGEGTDLIQILEKSGWTREYSDDVAVVLTQPKPVDEKKIGDGL